MQDHWAGYEVLHKFNELFKSIIFQVNIGFTIAYRPNINCKSIQPTNVGILVDVI